MTNFNGVSVGLSIGSHDMASEHANMRAEVRSQALQSARRRFDHICEGGEPKRTCLCSGGGF